MRKQPIPVCNGDCNVRVAEASQIHFHKARCLQASTHIFTSGAFVHATHAKHRTVHTSINAQYYAIFEVCAVCSCTCTHSMIVIATPCAKMCVETLNTNTSSRPTPSSTIDQNFFQPFLTVFYIPRNLDSTSKNAGQRASSCGACITSAAPC